MIAAGAPLEPLQVCRHAGANLENCRVAKEFFSVKIIRAIGGCLGARSR
jgi:hypothetical protein